MFKASISLIPAVLLAAGCASTPGSQPHDMSVVQHEAMAKQQDEAAQGHGSQFDPGATKQERQCSGSVPSKQVCWTTDANPTAAHKEEAEKHRKAAADHRAASQALRDAEASACAGVPEEDRDASPFHHREDITEVTAITEAANPKAPVRTVGATVTFRAVPGMTAEWLQRVADCHLARNASLGFSVAEMPYCPLVLKGVTARASSTGNGFAIAVRANEQATAEEILKRARALKP